MGSDGKTLPPLRPVWLIALLSIAGFAGSLFVLSPGLPRVHSFAALFAFLSRAVQPAFFYEADFVPEGAQPLLLKALVAAYTTLEYAAAGVGIALVFGVPLGFLSTARLWSRPEGSAPVRMLLGAAYLLLRLVITFARSIHELLWAVLFLAAFGLTSAGAVLAIAIPYAGVFAKVFSDLIDESPTGASEAFRLSGANALQCFFFGRIPRALPDMAAYVMYRFECALRSSAILGFFGIPTLGYFISASFENLYYGEVWTYLYVLFGLIAAFDAWSAMLRKGMAQ